MYRSATCQSPVGMITLASDGKSLAGLWIEGQKHHGANILPASTPSPRMPIFDETQKWLDRYFAKKTPPITDLPIAPAGTGFRQQVWKILCAIPYGEVVTYGDIAKKIAAQMGRKTMASRAIGGAVGHNPISIIIPCHRVIGSDGSLTGYAGGIDIKIKLLEIEGAETRAGTSSMWLYGGV